MRWLLVVLSLIVAAGTSFASQRWASGSASDTGAAYSVAFGKFAETRIGSYIYLAAGGKLIWTEGRAAYLVVPAKNIDDSHVSSGTLGVAYLDSSGDGFSLRKRWLKAGGWTTWGGEPDFSISTKFGSNPIVYTEGGGTWQGCTSSVAQLVELLPSGPTAVADFVSYGLQSGRNVKGTISNIKPNVSFDVVYTGGKRIVERYVKRAGKYRLVNGKSKVETC